MLVSFCGLDGSGKTTQVRLLADRLRTAKEVCVLRSTTPAYAADPEVVRFLAGDTPDADIPGVLRHVGMLSAADRLRQFRTEVRPRLLDGCVVILDRFVFSAYAWAVARGFRDLRWLRELNRHLPTPDVSIVLDVDPLTALGRLRARGDQARWEERDLARVAAVRAALLTQPWGRTPGYWVLDGSRPAGELATEIAALVAAAAGGWMMDA
ncbi:dTMP kinase [Fodinicola acaciae]|uniref:dTMP kinase n=1 Tax=Fodinicola acaciae TaxID=2681555 RepID=UPI001FE32C55|nr:dTMP kinase [Fodinicola acaciae]